MAKKTKPKNNPSIETPENKKDNLFWVHPDNIIIRPGFNPKWAGEACPDDVVDKMVEMIKATGTHIGKEWAEPGRIHTAIRTKPEKECSGTPPRWKNTGRMILVHGETRVLAAKKIWKEIRAGKLPYEIWQHFMVPCTCVPEGYTELQELMENYTGNNTINPIKGIAEAKFIKKLMDGFHQEDNVFVQMTDKQIAQHIGKSIVHVRDTQLLLEAPEEVQQLVMEGNISPTFVIESMKEYKDPETVKEKILAASKVAEEEGSEKVSAKHLDQVEERVNSLSLLKKVLKRIEKDELMLPPTKKKLFDFLKGVIDGKLSGPQIEVYLTNQLAIQFPTFTFESADNESEYEKELKAAGMVEEIQVSEESMRAAFGRQIAGRIFKKWDEDFTDEDTGEVVTINRSEAIINGGTIDVENATLIIESGVKKILVYKPSSN